jgi:hypothetical protein
MQFQQSGPLGTHILERRCWINGADILGRTGSRLVAIITDGKGHVMATRVSIDGTANGEYMVRDLRVFLETWDHLGMPDDARIHAKTKITGSGPLKTLTAEYEGTGVNSAAVPAESQSSAKPYIPGLVDDDQHPTMPVLPRQVDNPPTAPLAPVTSADLPGPPPA